MRGPGERTGLLLGLLSLLGMLSLGLVASRVSHHHRAELRYGGPWVGLPSAGQRTVLGRARLRYGHSVLFEVCSANGFPPDRWQDRVVFEVWHAESDERVVTSALDAARMAQVRRGRRAACVDVAQAASLGVDGEYAVVVWRPAVDPPADLDGNLRARVTAQMPMEPLDLGALGLCASVAFALLLVLGLRAQSLAFELGSAMPVSSSAHPERRAAVALVALFAGMFAVGALPLGGPAGVLAQAGLIVGLQLGLCALLAEPAGEPVSRRATLGLAPARARALLFAAPVFGLALLLAGRWVSGLFPSTFEAPIEVFVASHGGYLVVAAVGLFAPLAEELFFRGLLYGFIERWRGANFATGAVTLAFVLAHIPQALGALGAVTSLALTGLVLTLLRRYGGSVVVPLAAHLTHNLAVAFFGFPA